MCSVCHVTAARGRLLYDIRHYQFGTLEDEHCDCNELDFSGSEGLEGMTVVNIKRAIVQVPSRLSRGCTTGQTYAGAVHPVVPFSSLGNKDMALTRQGEDLEEEV